MTSPWTKSMILFTLNDPRAVHTVRTLFSLPGFAYSDFAMPALTGRRIGGHKKSSAAPLQPTIYQESDRDRGTEK
jgi:hypothetical protein